MNQATTNIAALTIDRHSKPQQLRLPIMKITAVTIAVALLSLYFLNSQTSIAQADNHQQTLKSTSTSTPMQQSIAADQLQKNRAPVTTTPTKVLDASGYIIARRVASVSSRVTGKLNQLYIEEGQHVTKNQVLAELDDEKAKISYQLALAELSATQAMANEAKVSLRYQQQRLHRNQELLQKNLISKQLSDDSEVKTAQLNAQLKNKMALVSLAEQKVDLALYQLNHHKIRAPFDGVVISKNAQVGELISAGSASGGSIRTGVGTIVDMDSLEIEVEVGESYINRVYAGQLVQATLDAYPNWHINSKVVAIIPTADRQKASIKVRIKLLEKDQRIFPDMGIKVSFLKS